MGFRDWLSKKKKPKELQESVSGVQATQHERITTIEQARATYQQADALYKKGDFNGAIALYDKLLDTPPGLLNPYEVRKVRAMAYCNAGRFSEAEEELKQLLDVLISYGGSTSSSSVRYWYLVALYKGDKKRAMDEFVKS